MEKNIVALLEQNLRVIVPEFGAFIIRQKDPRMVIFNEFLRYDDGLLVDQIVKANRMEPEAARKELSNYVEFANKELDAGNEFSIEGLGTLKKDQAGKIVFTETGAVEVQATPREGFEPVFRLEEEDKPQPKPKATKSAKTTEGVLKSRGKKEVIPSSPAPEIPINKPVEDSPTTVITPVIPEKAAVVETPVEIAKPAVVETPVEKAKPAGHEQKKAGGVPPKVVEARPYPQKSVEKQENVKPGKAVKWLIGLLIFNSLIIIFFIFKDHIPGLQEKHKKPVSLVSDSLLDQLTDSMMAAVSDTTSANTGTETVKSNTPTVDPVQSATQTGMKYYIVAGCFRDEINADELVISLKKMGYKAEKFGKIGDLYAVSFVSFFDKDEAVNELKKIRENMHPEAWMTRF